jgi:hypothetical protein
MKEIHHMTGNYFHVPVNSNISLLDAPPSTRYNLPADVNGVVTTYSKECFAKSLLLVL